jgi:hypothetical protein
MSAYTEIICPCTTRQARYKKYSPDAQTPPSGSYSPSLSLGTGISTYCEVVKSVIGLYLSGGKSSHGKSSVEHSTKSKLYELTFINLFNPHSPNPFGPAWPYLYFLN